MDFATALALVGALLALLMAVGVLAFAPHQRVNKALAAFLALAGVLQAGNVVQAFDHALPAYASLAFFLVAVPMAGLLAPSYLFVVAALDTPLVAWLARPRARRAIWAFAGLASATIALLLVSGVIVGLRGDRNVPYVDTATTIYFLYVTASVVATAVFALVATVSAFRRSVPGSVQRGRARAWLLAFGTQDTILVLAGILNIIGSAQDPAGTANNFGERVSNVLLPAAFILSLPLLAYGIAKTQLFDIDLRVKWGAARGAVTAVLVAVFFVVEKLVESYASRVLGVTFGAIAAGLMLFFVPRLNRAADKVANKAAPSVQPTSEYVSFKKLEVYRAAVESAMEEGGGKIDERGHGILSRLRAKLKLAESDAMAVEAEVAEG